MSQLQKSLNNLISITTKLYSPPTFADYMWENNNKVYNTQLGHLSAQFTYGLTPVNKNRREKVLIKWNNYLENHSNEIIFSTKELEILAFEAELLLYEEFWNILIDVENVTSKTVIGLVYSFYKNWDSLISKDNILSVLQQLIHTYNGNNKIIQLWRKNLRYVLSKETPQLIAKDCVYKNISLNDISKKYFINLTHTKLEIVILEIILQEKLLKYEKERNISIEKVKEIANEIATVNFYKSKSNLYYALLIKVVEITQNNKNLSKDFLKEHLLSHIDYKDPRKNPEKWLNFDEEAKRIFISWLNEEDIKIFFDLFIDYDPHGRKAFWLNYIKHIQSTQIIQCPTLYQNMKNKQKIMELERKGFDFPKLINGQTNAFILYFDKFTIIEFSETGNACYIYKKDNFEINKIIKDSINIDKLKNRNYVHHKVNHNTGWQYNLKNWLAYRGIR